METLETEAGRVDEKVWQDESTGEENRRMSKNPTKYLPGPTDLEVSRWVRQLQEAEARLRDLLGDRIDAVLGSGGQTFLLQEAQEKLMASEAEARRSEAMLKEAQRIARFAVS